VGSGYTGVTTPTIVSTSKASNGAVVASDTVCSS
jgi:hypothetical protein